VCQDAALRGDDAHRSCATTMTHQQPR
jgi:hypothetical protein